MAFLLLCTVGSVALGAALPWLPGMKRGALGPLRTFALAAALTVVTTHLLPEAAEQLGVSALFFFGIGLVLPGVVERVGVWLGRTATSKSEAHAHWASAHLGYLGLVVHQLTEGAALGAYPSASAADVAVALGAHTIPLTALVMMGFTRSVGRSGAIVRAAGLAVASAGGILLGHVATPLVHDGAPWMTAIAGGLVLHLVGHDLKSDAPRTTMLRFFELVALAAGVALTLVGIRAHQSATGDSPEIQHHLVHLLADYAMATAPPLLVGLTLGALIQTRGLTLDAQGFARGSTLLQALRGAFMGVPLPLCACGIVPLARTMSQRGAGPSLVVSFLLSTPVIGIETFALTARFLGWSFAGVRVVAALILAIMGGLIAALVRKQLPAQDATSDEVKITPSHVDAEQELALTRRFSAAFDEMMLHTAPWVFVGIVGAAYADTLLTNGSLDHLAGSGKDILIVTAIAVPSYVCASSATPFAAVLIAKGISPGAVLAGLLLGPITNVASATFLARAYGKRTAFATLLALVVATWGLSLAANAWLPASSADLPLPTGAHEHSILSMVAALVLVALITRALWLSGARAWVASLVGLHEHGHVHDAEESAEPS
ncbi:MAG: permease [Polyangiaceae bacterium]